MYLFRLRWVNCGFFITKYAITIIIKRYANLLTNPVAKGCSLSYKPDWHSWASSYKTEVNAKLKGNTVVAISYIISKIDMNSVNKTLKKTMDPKLIVIGNLNFWTAGV